LRAALQSWIAENSTQGFSPEPEAVSDCRLTDLSLGACYIETASPFPERTQVVLILRAESVEFRAEGVVRVMHPSRGMGVEFAMRTDEQRKQPEGFISFLTSRPGVQPELRVAPQPLTAEDSDREIHPDQPNECSVIDDALLDLLHNHDSFSEEMFLQALRSQRSAECVES
jgi:hypothetical protein